MKKMIVQLHEGIAGHERWGKPTRPLEVDGENRPPFRAFEMPTTAAPKTVRSSDPDRALPVPGGVAVAKGI